MAKQVYRRGLLFPAGTLKSVVVEQENEDSPLPQFAVGDRILWAYPNTGKIKVEAIK